MKCILVWHNKYESVYWDASTPELEDRAFLALFQGCDEYQYYSVGMDKTEKALYKRAKKGDVKAAKELCRLRKNAEYEEWSLEPIQETI